MCIIPVSRFPLPLGVCLATMVMSPVPGAVVAPLITGQLCAFREHVTMRNFKVYSHYQLKSDKMKQLGQDGSGAGAGAAGAVAGSAVAESKHAGETAGVAPRNTVGKDSVQDTTSSGDFSKETSSSFQSSDASFQLEGSGSSGAQHHPVLGAELPSSVTSDPLPAPPFSPQETINKRYLNMAKECTNKLVSIAEEGLEEGWLEVGTTKNIHVLKKLPEDDESPTNSIKGTGVVDAPPEFILRLLQDPVHTTALDDLLKETRVVEELSPAVTLVQLLYKAVWPTSPRDFAVLSVGGQVNDTTWISSGSSIVDDRIPPEKGYVRADLLGGGYVIHSMSNKPDKSIVTYAACVNLKGSIPAFAVNKIAESQPMCIHNLRKLAEPLYKKMVADPQAMADFQAKFPIPKAFEDESAQMILPGQTAAAAAPNATTTPAHEEGGGSLPATAGPMLQDRLAQSQWHFDPSSLPPVSSELLASPEAQKGEDSATKSRSAFGGADDAHYRFQTPPVDSDQEHEDTDSKDPEAGKLADSALSVPSQDPGLDKGSSSPAHAQSLDPSPPAHKSRSSTSLDLSTTSIESRSRASSVPSNRAALQLSQYTPGNGHLPGQVTVCGSVPAVMSN